MRIINVTPKMDELLLGRLGENEVTKFVFDVSDWLEEYPGGTIGLANRLPHTRNDYACTITSEGDGKYSWTITSAELTTEGSGKCELILIKDSKVKKGKVYKTRIGEAMDPDQDPPSVWQGYVTDVLHKKEDAEAYAIGKRSGTDVGETDPTYHNNAKYYSEQASGSASAAAGSATTAGGKAQDAEAYAIGKRGGTDVESTDPAYHNNSKYYAENCESLIEAATTTATTNATAAVLAAAEGVVDGYSKTSEAYAVGKRGGTDVGSSDPAYHNNSKYYSEQAATSATAAHTAQLAAEAAAAEEVSDWLAAHVDPETGYVIDNTLTVTGAAADAKKVGDKIGDLISEIDALPDIVEPEETGADLYVCDSNGNVIAKFADGHIVTKNFDSANIKTGIFMEASSDDADLYITDTFGNVIAEFADGHIITKNFDSSDYTDVLGDVAELETDVSALKTETTGILYRTKAQTDGVYACCRYKQPSLSSKQFCLLLGGDNHYDSIRMNSMIEYLNNIDAFDAGIMLGDISGNQFSDSIEYYLTALSNATKPFLTVIGNHDVVGATSDTDLYTKYGDCFQYANLASGEAVSGKCYYYKDFSTQKIRVIVLMQYDLAGRSSDTGDLCFGQDQINWLISTLNSTPSDYGVIIAEHTNPSRYMTYNMDEECTSSTWARTNYAPSYMNGDPVPDIVNAWINGGTLSQTYSYTFDNPPSALSVSADFTSRGAGEFITYIGGHWHMDVLGTPTSYTNQNDYHVPAAGLSAATQGDIPRRSGTVSEDSLCAMAVDRGKKTVKIFHIGAHYTKDAIDRQYFKYSYGS